MTRYEWIKQASAEQLAKMLCDMTENIVKTAGGCNCLDCPMQERCLDLTSRANGYVNGYSSWLEKEVEYQETDNEKIFCEIKVF